MNTKPNLRCPGSLLAGSLWTLSAATVILAFVGSLFAQNYAPASFPTDWSSRHMIYSRPGSQALAVQLESEPRYIHQQLRRNATMNGDDWVGRVISFPPTHRMHRDWSVNLGNSAKVGANQYPAKFSYSANSANCGNTSTPDYVVFNTSLAGSASQASILAYDNLYSSCPNTVPTVYWQYNTGGTVVTSPVLSEDGSQVAFVQTQSSVATLVVLKWASSTTLVTLTAVANSSYRSCTAPCMTTITFNGSPTDTASSPFCDFANDTLFVGDAKGALHRFNGVFNGTPSEYTTNWPVTLTANNVVSSPVYDGVSGRIFAGDNAGYLYLVNCTTSCSTSGQVPTTRKSIQLGAGASPTGIADGPIVDGAAGTVYATLGAASWTGGPTNPTGTVVQFSTSFANGASPAGYAAMGTSVPAGALTYDGSFDNAYYTSSDPPTGNLYVCSGSGSGPNVPVSLWQIRIASGSISTVTQGPTLTNSSASVGVCSGATEFYNQTTSTDYVFLGVTTQALQTIGGSASGCGSGGPGCIMSFVLDDSSPYTIPSKTTAGLAETNGTSGIVVDNYSNVTGASQVYFSTLGNQNCTTGGNGGCAIQASQAALQ